MARQTARQEAQSPADEETVTEVDPRYSQGSSTDLVARAKENAANLPARNAAVVQGFVNWLAQRAETTDEDQFELMAQITAEILESDNMAELMAEATAVHARDVVGIPMILHGFEVREGTFEQSPLPFYVAMTCGKPGVERTRVVTCGAMKVLAKLKKMEDLINDETNDEQWPQVIMFTEKRTSAGNTVLDIVRP